MEKARKVETAASGRGAGRLARGTRQSDLDVLCEAIDVISGSRVDPVYAHGALGVLGAVRAGVVGLGVALNRLAGSFASASGTPADVRFSAPAPPGPVPAAIYWAVLEALTKVEFCARATGVVVSVRTVDDRLELLVRDDGVGLIARQGPGDTSPLFGIRAMARCMEAVGGEIRVMPAEPRGLLIRGTAPGPSAATGTSRL